MLTYLLDCRVFIYFVTLLELMCFCLEAPKHFYIRGSVTLVNGLIILEFIDIFVFNLCESILFCVSVEMVEMP